MPNDHIICDACGCSEHPDCGGSQCGGCYNSFCSDCLDDFCIINEDRWADLETRKTSTCPFCNKKIIHDGTLLQFALDKYKISRKALEAEYRANLEGA